LPTRTRRPTASGTARSHATRLRATGSRAMAPAPPDPAPSAPPAPESPPLPPALFAPAEPDAPDVPPVPPSPPLPPVGAPAAPPFAPPAPRSRSHLHHRCQGRRRLPRHRRRRSPSYSLKTPGSSRRSTSRCGACRLGS
jgi:hypothetical protein